MTIAFPALADDLTNIYDVLRNGKKIGTHVITFKRMDDRLIVQAETHMSVKLLFINAFSYDYLSREVWEDGTLVQINTTTNDNGTDIQTDAVWVDGAYDISIVKDGDTVNEALLGPILPTNHWNVAALKQSDLFDSIKGRNFPIAVVKSDLRNHPHFLGQRYDVSGEYDYSTYYDPAGHWHGMAFQRKQGFIEFRCVDCENMPAWLP